MKSFIILQAVILLCSFNGCSSEIDKKIEGAYAVNYIRFTDNKLDHANLLDNMVWFNDKKKCSFPAIYKIDSSSEGSWSAFKKGNHIYLNAEYGNGKSIFNGEYKIDIVEHLDTFKMTMVSSKVTIVCYKFLK